MSRCSISNRSASSKRRCSTAGCDVIIEHIEYLHTEAAKGKKTTLFCAPQIQRGLQLVVPQSFNSLDDLRGKAMAVRDLGRPHRITLWLRKVGLENSVKDRHRA